MPSKTPPRWILAAYYWSPYLTFAVLNGEHIVELVSRRLSGGRRATATLQAHFQALARDYAPDQIIIPAVAALYAAGVLTGHAVETLSIATAKERLLGRRQGTLHRDLFTELVRRYPQLQPYLPKLTGGRSDVAAVRSRSAVQLLPVALGLAAAAAPR